MDFIQMKVELLLIHQNLDDIQDLIMSEKIYFQFGQKITYNRTLYSFNGSKQINPTMNSLNNRKLQWQKRIINKIHIFKFLKL